MGDEVTDHGDKVGWGLGAGSLTKHTHLLVLNLDIPSSREPSRALCARVGPSPVYVSSLIRVFLLCVCFLTPILHCGSRENGAPSSLVTLVPSRNTYGTQCGDGIVFTCKMRRALSSQVC